MLGGLEGLMRVCEMPAPISSFTAAPWGCPGLEGSCPHHLPSSFPAAFPNPGVSATANLAPLKCNICRGRGKAYSAPDEAVFASSHPL